MDPSGDVILQMVMSYGALVVCTACIVMGSCTLVPYSTTWSMVLSSIPWET